MLVDKAVLKTLTHDASARLSQLISVHLNDFSMAHADSDRIDRLDEAQKIVTFAVIQSLINTEQFEAFYQNLASLKTLDRINSPMNESLPKNTLDHLKFGPISCDARADLDAKKAIVLDLLADGHRQIELFRDSQLVGSITNTKENIQAAVRRLRSYGRPSADDINAAHIVAQFKHGINVQPVQYHLGLRFISIGRSDTSRAHYFCLIWREHPLPVPAVPAEIT